MRGVSWMTVHMAGNTSMLKVFHTFSKNIFNSHILNIPENQMFQNNPILYISLIFPRTCEGEYEYGEGIFSLSLKLPFSSLILIQRSMVLFHILVHVVYNTFSSYSHHQPHLILWQSVLRVF